jgi:hypothetical protein
VHHSSIKTTYGRESVFTVEEGSHKSSLYKFYVRFDNCGLNARLHHDPDNDEAFLCRFCNFALHKSTYRIQGTFFFAQLRLPFEVDTFCGLTLKAIFVTAAWSLQHGTVTVQIVATQICGAIRTKLAEKSYVNLTSHVPLSCASPARKIVVLP